MKLLSKRKLALASFILLFATLVPGVARADQLITIIPSTTTPALYDPFSVFISGLQPGQSYSVQALVTFGSPVNLGNVTSDSTGEAMLSTAWMVPANSCDLSDTTCVLQNAAFGIYRTKLVLCKDSDPCAQDPEQYSVLATSRYIYAGLNNRMGSINVSGNGVQNGKLIPGKTIHIEAENVGVGGQATTNLGIYVVSTSGQSIDAFWDAVNANIQGSTLVEANLDAGSYSGDVEVPSDIPTASSVVQYYYYGLTGDPQRPVEAGITSVPTATIIAGPPPTKPTIKSITKSGSAALVDFSTVTLNKGRYDRVAYSVNGGKWNSWGLYAKSIQVIRGLRPQRTYSIRIKAHVKGGSWTLPSEPVEVKM